ncbi:MAG TPA: SET domain-containing protein-lysine N-methyltransferase [Gemmatimonadota bacterium]|nr:SET domain-containing protein-lysine N-methyltransferase [Gemmatimonadota bacterium]
MRICLLTNQDLDGGSFPEDDWPCDPRPFLPDAEWEVAVLEKATAVRRVEELSRRGFDLFFNLCDGAWDEDTPGIQVVQALERLGLPFTGAGSTFYEPSREAMKRVCRAWGLDTPAYAIAREWADVERAADTLRFPLIVKHPSSYASLGLTRASRVETPGALLRQAERMMDRYAGALIEEFIEGRECTALVAENPDAPGDPVTYAPIEYRFPAGETFKHADMKWVDYRALEAFPVREDELAAALRRDAALFFRGMRGAGYGRCDFRVDREGRRFVLEINPNCGLYYAPEDAGSADLCLLHDEAGHEGFTRQIVRAALARHACRQRPWEVRPRGEDGYGLHAARPIAEGERILAFEEREHRLVSLSRVQASWDERERAWFERYAWPLTEETWVIWSRDPEAWKPVNHSCDPSAWLEGLDVVARRPVGAGEEITLDYATFYNERMPAFECDCGTEACRGIVRGTDYLEAFLDRYGEHVSDYVRRKRREVVRALHG